MTKEIKIIIGIGVVVIVGAFALFFVQPKAIAPSAPVDGSKLLRQNSHMTKTKDAKVQVVEFGDYQCPACAAASPNLSKLRDEYKDNANVNFVFRHYPLPQHSQAIIGATAAEAAAKQGKFWEMTDLIYANQSSWVGASDPTVEFNKLADQLHLNVDTFKQDSNQTLYQEIINADKSDGDALGVNSTPTIFVNGEKASDYAYATIKNLIESKLK